MIASLNSFFLLVVTFLGLHVVSHTFEVTYFFIKTFMETKKQQKKRLRVIIVCFKHLLAITDASEVGVRILFLK